MKKIIALVVGSFLGTATSALVDFVREGFVVKERGWTSLDLLTFRIEIDFLVCLLLFAIVFSTLSWRRARNIYTIGASSFLYASLVWYVGSGINQVLPKGLLGTIVWGIFFAVLVNILFWRTDIFPKWK